MKLKFFLLFILCLQVFGHSQEGSNKLSNDIDSIIQNIKSFSTDKERVYYLTGSAGKNSYVGNTKKLIEKAIEIAENSNQEELLAQSHFSLGTYFYFNSKPDSALFYNDKAYGYLKENQSFFLKAKILNSKGAIFAKQGNVIKGISAMLESKKIMSKIDTLTFSDSEKFQYKGQNLVLNNSLANFYNQMDDFDMALFYYDEAYNAALQNKSITYAGVIMSNKGDLLLNFNKIPEAIEALERGKKLKIEGNAHPRLIANSDMNIGLAYSKSCDYDKGLLFLNKAHNHYVSNHLDSRLALVLNLRGELFLKKKSYERAKTDCEKAKQLADKLNDLETYMNACKCLYEANKNLNLFQASLINHENYLIAKDSLFNKKNVKKQTQLEMQFTFDKEQEIQKIEAYKKEKQRKLYLFLAIIGLAVVLLLLLLYSKNRNKNKQLATQKALLEKTVGEKNMLLKETHHRVKNSFQIVSGLLFLQASSIKDKAASKALKETQNRINSMAVLHQKLYKQDHTSGIDCKDYITALMGDILSSYSMPNIEKKLLIEPIIMDIEVMTSIGLIINELVTNSLKYAFSKKGNNDYIEISVRKKQSDIFLEIIDNGIGISEKAGRRDSLGLSLVKDLAQKINGKINFESLQNKEPKGTKVTIVLKEKDIL